MSRYIDSLLYELYEIYMNQMIYQKSLQFQDILIQESIIDEFLRGKIVT